MTNVHQYKEMLENHYRSSDIKAGVKVILVRLPFSYHPSPGCPLYDSEFSAIGVVKSVTDGFAFVEWNNTAFNAHRLEYLAVYHDDNEKVNPNHAFNARKRQNGII